ncbi:MAG: 2-phospho-L-lactate transferase [Methanocalculus sp. MSAO_Arc1]|uniref:2-phospho-L-lactate transferase n=1 Tax=Methanocalculus TaxID=71151 RepID=UPI000FF033A3|nr:MULTISPECIES: 2-phospho-L-lactate transferase [unclassified Methanocalculus]MCP1662885.1 LPPG:FO 2-phospho-L-lactate transferase [Methanocalculus sp. AMF5]RQD80034.1 MAG: 2-phospho-L-lactate transferase [Methanocalculus sp. MSAO_Arc1]
MITLLSGGTGTPKLLQGIRQIENDPDISVIVNTAEDIWVSGNHLSPDIDTVLYLFAGILNTETWWGIRGDSFETNRYLERIGLPESIAIGDRDRAVHIARGELLRQGKTLTEATDATGAALGVQARVLPMCDTPVATCVAAETGPMHFQEYWVKHRGNVRISGIIRQAETPPVATEASIDAIQRSEAVIIGPSNPVTSIGPILECRGMREALAEAFVIAVSPFIGSRPISGPAAALMEAWGKTPDSRGTREAYGDIVDIFVQDTRDEIEVGGSLRLDTMMTGIRQSESLAWDLLSLVRAR